VEVFDPVHHPPLKEDSRLTSVNILHDRKHVFSDLEPYVCTFEDCALNSQLFTTRSEWFQHEMDCHRQRYVCIPCGGSTQEYASPTELLNHFTVMHPGSVSSGQASMLAEISRRSIKTFDSSSCPFCQDWIPTRLSSNSKDFSKHLARHLRQLALDALPLAIEGLTIVESKEDDTESLHSDSEIGAEVQLTQSHGEDQIREPVNSGLLSPDMIPAKKESTASGILRRLSTRDRRKEPASAEYQPSTLVRGSASMRAKSLGHARRELIQSRRAKRELEAREQQQTLKEETDAELSNDSASIVPEQRQTAM